MTEIKDIQCLKAIQLNLQCEFANIVNNYFNKLKYSLDDCNTFNLIRKLSYNISYLNVIGNKFNQSKEINKSLVAIINSSNSIIQKLK